MGGFKFPFQDKADKFTCVNASATKPLFRGLFQEAACRKKSFGEQAPLSSQPGRAPWIPGSTCQTN